MKDSPESRDAESRWTAPPELFSHDLHDPVHFDIGAVTDVGKARRQNQDHFAVYKRRRSQQLLMSDLPAEDFQDVEDHAYVLLVADGIGGSAFGEYAARLLVYKIWELGAQAVSWLMRLREHDLALYQQRVDAYAEVLQHYLDCESDQQHLQLDMGSTITAAYIVGRDALVSNVGDSRAYLFRAGQLDQITDDQTVAQQLIKSGYDADKVAGFDNVLANYFGSGMARRPHVDLHYIALQPGDQLLLCSDGLTKEVADPEICDQLAKERPPQEACDALLQQTLERGARDNVTIVLAAAAESP